MRSTGPTELLAGCYGFRTRLRTHAVSCNQVVCRKRWIRTALMQIEPTKLTVNDVHVNGPMVSIRNLLYAEMSVTTRLMTY